MSGRYCNHCRRETPTVDECCPMCGLSKPTPEYLTMTIKHCPFCGGPGKLADRLRGGYIRPDAVECTVCGATGQPFVDDREAAIRVWNTRSFRDEPLLKLAKDLVKYWPPRDADIKAMREFLEKMGER